MAFMQQIPPSVYLTLQKYIPEEYGFGVRLFGKGSQFEWDAVKNVDTIVKLFDYLLPQILIAAKVLAAAALLVGNAIDPGKSAEADGGSSDTTDRVHAKVFELSENQAYYLKAQMLRGVVAAVAGPVGLLFADALTTAYSSDNAPLLEKYNEYVPEFLSVRA